MDRTLTLRIERELPSWNVVMRWHWAVRAREQENWDLAVRAAASRHRDLPIRGAVRLDVTCFYGPVAGKKVIRRPDWDNQCLKFLVDALRRSVIGGDSVRWVVGGELHAPHKTVGNDAGHTVVKVQVWDNVKVGGTQ